MTARKEATRDPTVGRTLESRAEASSAKSGPHLGIMPASCQGHAGEPEPQDTVPFGIKGTKVDLLAIYPKHRANNRLPVTLTHASFTSLVTTQFKPSSLTRQIFRCLQKATATTLLY